MRAYSLNELFRLTRNELFKLHAKMVDELSAVPLDDPGREIAFENLRIIRRLLATPHYSPSS